MYELSLEASPGERTSVPRVELREARWRLREEDPGRDMLRECCAEAGALPEEQPSYIHAHCYLLFTARRAARWEPFLLSSPTAAWFI